MTLISLIRSLDLTIEYSIAGLRVFTNRVAEQEEVYTSTDGKVLVVNVGKETNLEECADLLRTSGANQSWHPFMNSNGLQVIGREDGQIVLIRDRNNVIRDYAAFLRFFVPFASGLQKRLVLHASAVQTKDGVVAFIGPSGVGKTTLARRLKEIGFLPVSDDLLPCRFAGQQVYIPLAPIPDSPRRMPLIRVYFLSRDTAIEREELIALGRMRHLQLQMCNGYSELAIEEIWKMQFTSYNKMVDSVDAFQLVLPDNIDYLDEVIKRHFENPYLVGDAKYAPLFGSNRESSTL